MLRVPRFSMPPPNNAVLPERVELETVTVPPGLLEMPPPSLPAVLPERVELETLTPPELVLSTPPPSLVAVLLEMVELETVTVPKTALRMPPPLLLAVFPERVELETLREPVLKMAPPVTAVLPERVELETERVPRLLKAPPAPPLPEVLFAPVTVTPEMARLPPVAIEKILKLPLPPLIIREEAPRPVMVTVPAVPPVIAALALIIVGNAALNKVIVLVPVKLKLI